MTVTFKRETINEQNIEMFEKLRYDAYGMIMPDVSYNETYYARELRNNKYLVYSAYMNDELIGACYVSNSHNSVYIEQLFVMKKLQKLGLGIGEKLLLWVLEDKKYIEQHFNSVCHKSYLSTGNAELERYYEKIGYKKIDDVYMKKSI